VRLRITFRQKANSYAKRGEAQSAVEMLGDSGDESAELVLVAIACKSVRFVRSGENKGFITQGARIDKSFTEQRMLASNVGPINLIEKVLVA
jgi:hypothetical protein